MRRKGVGEVDIVRLEQVLYTPSCSRFAALRRVPKRTMSVILTSLQVVLGRSRLWMVSFPAVLLTAVAGVPATAQSREPLPQDLRWVELFNGEIVSWLENGNLLDTLCTEERHTPPWHECRDEKLLPKLLVIPLYAEPRADAVRRGEIVIVAQPEKGLKAFASADRRVEPFTPDLYDPDWGYGPPYFHQTVLENRGTWYRIPVPLVGVAWMNADDLRRSPAQDLTLALDDGEIILVGDQDLVVLGVKDRVLIARPEQERDSICDQDSAPPPAPWQEIRLPFQDLFDAQGHLRIKIKYTRGC